MPSTTATPSTAPGVVSLARQPETVLDQGGADVVLATRLLAAGDPDQAIAMALGKMIKPV